MKYHFPVILFLVLFGVAVQIKEVQAEKAVFCYWGTWSHYRPGNANFEADNIDGNLCTHVFYAFFGATTAGNAVSLDDWLDNGLSNVQKTMNLKTKYPNLKIMASFGGWSHGSQKFSQLAETSATRQLFATNVLNLLNKYGFDGADIDWEYPGQNGGNPSIDKNNFNLLLQALSSVLKPQGKLLTIATAATEASASISYDIPTISKYVDYINLMTYDFHGSYDGKTGFNAPLYAGPGDTDTSLSVDAAVSAYLAKGAPAQKLVLGMPMYGRTFLLTDASQNGVNAPVSGALPGGPYAQEAGFYGYSEFCEKLQAGGWTRVWDDTRKGPYAYSDNQWVAYDDVQSITLKTQYAATKKLGGVMVWSIETDDFRGSCNQGKFPLLTAINKAWNGAGGGGSGGPNPQPTTTSKAGTTIQVTRPSVTVPTTTRGQVNPTSTSKSSGSGSGAAPVCNKVGNMKHPDCSKFYSCGRVGDVAVPMSCSGGLKYNAVGNYCDWPDNVQC